MSTTSTGASAVTTTGATGASSTSAAGEEPTLGALVASASRDLSALVHDEVALAKSELREDVKRAGAGAGMFAVAGVLALLASFALTIALGYFLVWLGLDESLAFLIVGVLYLAVAGLLAFIGLKQVKKVKPPERTIATTKDTVAQLKGAATS